MRKKGFHNSTGPLTTPYDQQITDANNQLTKVTTLRSAYLTNYLPWIDQIEQANRNGQGDVSTTIYNDLQDWNAKYLGQPASYIQGAPNIINNAAADLYKKVGDNTRSVIIPGLNAQINDLQDNITKLQQQSNTYINNLPQTVQDILKTNAATDLANSQNALSQTNQTKVIIGAVTGVVLIIATFVFLRMAKHKAA